MDPFWDLPLDVYLEVFGVFCRVPLLADMWYLGLFGCSDMRYLVILMPISAPRVRACGTISRLHVSMLT